MGDIVLVENSEETAHEELIVLDRSGRLQLPKDFMDALEIKGGDKVKVELDENGEKLVLFRSGGDVSFIFFISRGGSHNEEVLYYLY